QRCAELALDLCARPARRAADHAGQQQGGALTNAIVHQLIAGEGSTNWSDSGEGTFVVKGQPGGSSYKAQNNTQSIITDPDTISRFSSELVAEHMIAQKQATGMGAATNKQLKAKGAKPAADAKDARPHPALVRHRASHTGT